MNSDRAMPLEFILGEDGPPAFSPVLDVGDRWKELPHAGTRSRGFVLLPGEEICTPPFLVDQGHCLFLEAMRAIEQVSADGLDLQVWLRTDEGDLAVGGLHLGNEQADATTFRIDLELRPFAGRHARLVLRCDAGRDGDPSGDWAAIVAMVVATRDRLELGKARSQGAWRVANELGRFVEVYRNEIYGDGPSGRSSAPRAVEVDDDPLREAGPRLAVADLAGRLARVQPEADENAFGFAVRLLAELLPSPVGFPERLASMAAGGRRLRILSLCAGEARVEAMLLQKAGVAADLTLVDLDPDLLERAGKRFPQSTGLSLVNGLVEAYVPPPGSFDIVLFVSGLHHVVELESVLGAAAAALAPDGEFWLIGEQVGPNGNRLWPDAQRVADALFRSLPDRLRYNHNRKGTDLAMPDLDFSSSCFEGIRSQEIPQVLARYFRPVVEQRRNCFLWRFIDLAYAANYDLGNEEDVQVLRRLVAEEVAFFAGGGLGCELNGAYRNKLPPGLPWN